MGVTIHFKGSLHNEAGLVQVVDAAQRLAQREGWEWDMIEGDVVNLERSLDDRTWNYTGPVRGVVLYPHENSEPLRFEFDRDLIVQDFIKTQFAPVEVHLKIVEFLKDIASNFKTLTVTDEGEYWSTESVDVLQKHRNIVLRLLHEQLTSRPDLVGPVQLPSGRIADLISRE